MTTWIKVYNSMPSHPKIVMAGDRAAWLAVCGLCYSNEHLTDGFIARHALPIVAPGVKGAEKLAERLVFVGAWLEVSDGWQINDYLEHQRSADEVRERRKRDAERKAANRSGGSHKGSPRGQNVESHAESATLDVDVEGREEKKTSSSAASGSGREMAKASEEDHANCRLFAELVRTRNSKARIPSRGTSAHEGWFRDMRLLREADGNRPEEIAEVIRWLYTGTSEDAVFWGTTIGAPSGLRSHFPQLWGKMTKPDRRLQAVESTASYLARRGVA